DEKRFLAMLGARFTQPLNGKGLKLLFSAAIGEVHSRVEGRGMNGLGIAPGIGFEWIGKYSGDGEAKGARLDVSYVHIIEGGGDHFLRVSIGYVKRFKK